MSVGQPAWELTPAYPAEIFGDRRSPDDQDAKRFRLVPQDDHIRGGIGRKLEHECDGPESGLWKSLWLECHEIGRLPPLFLRKR